MNIVIRNTGDMPIYEQIVVQIKQAIVAGELTEGEALPSMRLLAKELRISLITTKRAYEELEREGFIVTMTGRGSFVAAKTWTSCGRNSGGGWRPIWPTPWTRPAPPGWTPTSCAPSSGSCTRIHSNA